MPNYDPVYLSFCSIISVHADQWFDNLASDQKVVKVVSILITMQSLGNFQVK